MLPPLLLLSLDLLFVYGLRPFFPTSVCAFSDAVQDRWNSHVWPTHTTTTAAVMPAAHAASGKFRYCQFGRRMSSLILRSFCLFFVSGF